MRSLALSCAILALVTSWAWPVLAQESGSTIAPGAARLGAGDEASEYWDLTAVFESGHRLFARFSISNEGPGSRTAYAVGQLVFPNGRVFPFKNGRMQGDWSLSDDRLRMKVGSSVLDLRNALHHFEVDKNKRGVKLFFDFEPGHEPLQWAEAPQGLNVELLALGVPIDGTIWLRDGMEGQPPVPLSGHVSLTHVFMDATETSLALQRIEPHLLGASEGGARAYLLELQPASGSPGRWLVARRADGSWLQTSDLEFVASGALPGGKEGYPVPSALVLRGPGLEGRVELRRRILAHDPLDLVPGPFRWLLFLRADPLHVWLESKASLRFTGSGEPLVFEGEGVTSIYFMNAVEKP